MKTAYEILERLMANKQSVLEAWKDKPFEKMKLIFMTEKGDIAEDFLAELLTTHDYDEVKVEKERRGDYDVSLGDSVFFEVKAATQDTNGNFQFNDIRYDTKSTHLFCLGITPDNLYYLLINKTELHSDKYNMVSMSRGSNSSFKLLRRIAQMNEFENFKGDVEKAIKETSSKGAK